MLNDISGVKTWSKVNEGLIKMYKAEVRRRHRGALLPIRRHRRRGTGLNGVSRACEQP